MSTANQLFCELAQHLGLVDLVVAGAPAGRRVRRRQHRDDLDQWDHDIARREWFEVRRAA